jgi:hypothetical protein
MEVTSHGQLDDNKGKQEVKAIITTPEVLSTRPMRMYSNEGDLEYWSQRPRRGMYFLVLLAEIK